MKIALLGMGTVGSGVARILLEQADLLAERVGEPMTLTHIMARSINNPYDLDLSSVTMVESIDEIVASDVDLVIELIGGVDHTFAFHKQLIQAGKHIVTANKDMLAQHIDELAAMANQKQVQIGYEATSGGGIPIIQPLEHALNAQHVERVMGILNGTTNFILTKMTEEGAAYGDVLKEAQELGYAEADPTNDVEGFDAQRKISLLSRLAYRRQINVHDIPVKGISQVDVEDLSIAAEKGLVMKLIGQSQFDGEMLHISVEPMFLPANHQLAHVRLAKNAIFVEGEAVGETMFYGPGAGSMETASAVVSDAMNIARFGFIGNVAPEQAVAVSAKETAQDYYIRLKTPNSQALHHLKEAGYTYESIHAEKGAFLLSNVTAEQLASIDESLGLSAAYPIVA